MTQKLDKKEIPATGWTALELKGDVVMMAVSQNGPIIMFGQDAYFVPWIEIVEYAQKVKGQATLPEGTRVLEEPTKH